MILMSNDPINFTLIFGCFTGFALVLMLKDTVTCVLTFIKGLKLH